MVDPASAFFDGNGVSLQRAIVSDNGCDFCPRLCRCLTDPPSLIALRTHSERSWPLIPEFSAIWFGRRRRLRPRRCLHRGRGPPSRSGRGLPPRANAVPSADGRDRADAAQPASTMHRRARSHGLAEGVGVRLARSGGVRYPALEARHRRWAALRRRTGDRRARWRSRPTC